MQSDDTKPNYLEPIPLVRVVLLLMILKHPGSTGYSLISLIKEFSNNLIDLRTGTAYNELRKMEKNKLVESEQDNFSRKKRCYVITDEGKNELKRLIANMKFRINSVLHPLVDAFESIQ